MTSTALRPSVVRVPGSTSNLGGGFDCIGMAVDLFLDASFEPGRHAFTVRRREDAVPGEDLVAVAFRRALEARGIEPQGLLRVRSGIPIACGLGSSAAALVAGATLGMLASGADFDPGAAFAFATAEEGHGDNAGASAYGGLVAALGGSETPRAIRLELSPSVGFAFAAPPTRVSTRAARAALPATVPHGVAAGAIGRTAALLTGLATGDADLLRRGFGDDLHVPYRLPLIPGSEQALSAAMVAGAWAGTVSGAGSGLLAVCAVEKVEPVAERMASALAEYHPAEGVQSFSLRPMEKGVQVLEQTGQLLALGQAPTEHAPAE